MRLVCSYCQKKLGTKAPLGDGSLTHGMCWACADHFAALWQGMSYGKYLERFAFPVVLVEGEGRVVAINRAACDFLGCQPSEVIGLLGGEALECARSRLPGGCGKTVHCATCAVRNSVNTTRETGEALTRVPARLKRSPRDFDLLISTTLEGGLVRVLVEPRADEPPPA